VFIISNFKEKEPKRKTFLCKNPKKIFLICAISAVGASRKSLSENHNKPHRNQFFFATFFYFMDIGGGKTLKYTYNSL
jgi:hypothetical protein